MKRLWILLPLLLLATACVPGASVVPAPTFALIEEDSGLLRLEPPGVGGGAAVFRLAFEVHNPNPVGLHLAGLDGELQVDGGVVASSHFPAGVTLPARGMERLTLDVEAPLNEAPRLAVAMARLVGGDRVPYQLDGTPMIEIQGVRQQLPRVTVARGELELPPLRAPGVRFDAAASGVRLRGATVEVDVGLVIDNPLPLGFLARGPELALELDGRTLGRATLPETPVPADDTSRAALRFEAGLTELGAALATRLRSGGGGLRVALDGALAFEIPGVATTRRALDGVGGALR